MSATIALAVLLPLAIALVFGAAWKLRRRAAANRVVQKRVSVQLEDLESAAAVVPTSTNFHIQQAWQPTGARVYFKNRPASPSHSQGTAPTAVTTPVKGLGRYSSSASEADPSLQPDDVVTAVHDLNSDAAVRKNAFEGPQPSAHFRVLPDGESVGSDDAHSASDHEQDADADADPETDQTAADRNSAKPTAVEFPDDQDEYKVGSSSRFGSEDLTIALPTVHLRTSPPASPPEVSPTDARALHFRRPSNATTQTASLLVGKPAPA